MGMSRYDYPDTDLLKHAMSTYPPDVDCQYEPDGWHYWRAIDHAKAAYEALATIQNGLNCEEEFNSWVMYAEHRGAMLAEYFAVKNPSVKTNLSVDINNIAKELHYHKRNLWHKFHDTCIRSTRPMESRDTLFELGGVRKRRRR